MSLVASKKDGGGKSRPISWFSEITADDKMDLDASEVVEVLLDVKVIKGLMMMSELTALVESIWFEIDLAEETNDVCILGLREAVGGAELKMLFVMEVELAEEEAKELR